jgi:hypothetical protein
MFDMGVDDTTWTWAPVDALQVDAGSEIWIAEFALGRRPDAYYLRVRTYKADAPDQARVRRMGPYPNVMSALTTVQGLIREALDALEGAIHGNGTGAAVDGAVGK